MVLVGLTVIWYFEQKYDFHLFASMVSFNAQLAQKNLEWYLPSKYMVCPWFFLVEHFLDSSRNWIAVCSLVVRSPRASTLEKKKLNRQKICLLGSKVKILFSRTNKSIISCASNPKKKHCSNKLRISGIGFIFKLSLNSINSKKTYRKIEGIQIFNYIKKTLGAHSWGKCCYEKKNIHEEFF